MKGYRIISAEQSIASYMIGFETNTITYDEYNNWSQYLQEVLTTKYYQAIVFHSKTHLDELAREDGGFLFDIGNCLIKLAKGKSKHHLDEYVLSHVKSDILLGMLAAADAYKKEKEISGLSL